MLNMSTYADWESGIVNRNFQILQNLEKDDRIRKIIAVDFLPLTWKKAAKHYYQNILQGTRQAEMLFGDLTSACYAKTAKTFVYTTVDSIFSWKTVAKELKKISKELNLQNVIFWSYNPLFIRFTDYLDEELFIFDTVDNWAEHKAYTKLVKKNKIINNYKKISQKADLIFTVSEELVDLYTGFGREGNVHWIPNGVDFAHFNDPELINKRNLLSDIETSIIGYLGTIESRVDIDLIQSIAKQHSDKTIALCGPIWADVQEEIEKKLKPLQNVIISNGRIHYDLAPSVINEFDVAIIPHKINKFVNSMNPMKMYDYLACGKPIVSTPGAGIDMFSDLIYIAKNAAEFNRQIQTALDEDSATKEQQRRDAAQKHNWSTTVQTMLSLIEKHKNKKE